jgi:RNA polymerase sigma factor (sigma-70 family)
MIRSRGMELLMAYKQEPSINLRNRLVRLNAGLVRKIAHRISHQCSEPYEDLEQIGYLGLIRAIERFNPGQGCAFSSFAVPYIRGEMLHFLAIAAPLLKFPVAGKICKKKLKNAKVNSSVSWAVSPPTTRWQTPWRFPLKNGAR